MAVYVQDSCTGTNGTALKDHTPNTGGAWNQGAGSGPTIQSNQLQAGAFTNNTCYNSTQSTNADYDCGCDIIMGGSAAASTFGGVLGRWDVAGSSYYAAIYDASNQRFELYKTISAVKTSLGTFATTFVQNNTYALILRFAGTTISLLVNGTTQVSVTDTSLSAKGNFGVYEEDVFQNAIQLDNLLFQDTPSGTTVYHRLPLLGVG